MSVEKDVATVLALEEPVKALLKAIKAARPAIERLEKADYPGADWVLTQVWDAVKTDEGFGTVAIVASSVEMFRESAGDLAAFDFRFYGVGDGRLTLKEATKEILRSGSKGDTDQRRVEGLRQYAASVA